MVAPARLAVGQHGSIAVAGLDRVLMHKDVPFNHGGLARVSHGPAETAPPVPPGYPS